ncbi:hypothetical protein [Enhygromyxa salina]|nr:hypothetical protein [Enhygromyxa salina]
MKNPSSLLTLMTALSLGLCFTACTSPDSDDTGLLTSTGLTLGSGSGDGDGDTTDDGPADTSTTGDGDGDPATTTGDGDGDTTGDGDGDGDGDTTGDGDGDRLDCTVISAEEWTARMNDMDTFSDIESAINPDQGDAIADVLLLQFFGSQMVGSVDLTSAQEANYATCATCVILFVDETTIFFQSEGTVEVTELGPELNEIAGNIIGVTLEEVTVNPNTFESTLVPGGGCFEIEGSFNTIAP